MDLEDIDINKTKKSLIKITNKWRSADHITLREVSIKVEDEDINNCKKIANYFYEKLSKDK